MKQIRWVYLWQVKNFMKKLEGSNAITVKKNFVTVLETKLLLLKKENKLESIKLAINMNLR